MLRDARRWIAAALAAFLIDVSGYAGPPEAQEVVRPGDRGPPPQSEPTAPAEVEDVGSREQRVLRQVIFRDRAAQSVLDRAEAALNTGDATHGVELLQQVFDQTTDHFIWNASAGRLSSGRHKAHRLLSQADAQTRRIYDWAYEPEAHRLLVSAKAAGDAQLVGDVARRYFHTAAGFEATDWLATRWLDRGEFALALRAWRQLEADEWHGNRIGEAIRRKSAIARKFARRAADHSESSEQEAVVRTAEMRTADARDGDVRPEGAVAARAEQPADARRGRSPVPYARPVWRMPLSADAAAPIEPVVNNWEIQQERNDARAVLVQSAVGVREAVALRTYDGICAADGATGRLLWSYAARTSFSRSAAQTQRAGADGASRINMLSALMNAYAGNSILGILATDGQRVFAVDAMEIRPRSASSPDEPHDPQGGAQRLSRSANRLIALDVFNPQREADGSIKPAWTVGGAAAATHWFYRMDVNDDGRVARSEFLGTREDFDRIDRDGDGTVDKTEADAARGQFDRVRLQGHFFLGPPLVLDGRLYVVTESEGQLNLVALRATTGEVLWVQGLGYVDRPIDEDPLRATLACTPSHAGGVIVCPTQIGILVGVDALDGALLWSYYYGDEDVAQPDNGWSFVAHHAFGNAGYRNLPLIDGNRVVMLPRQSNAIHCVDLSTGYGVWKKPRNDCEYVAAAADGVVMVVGERVCRGLALESGDERWSLRLGEVSGCGVQIGREYLLPLAQNRIASIDIARGTRRGSSSPEGADWEPDDLAKADPDDDAPTAREPNEPRDDGIAERGSRPAETGIATDAVHADTPANDDDASPRRAPKRAAGDRRPGNLAAGGPYLFSVGPREIVAYRRAEDLLDDLRRNQDDGRRTPEDRLVAAELELTLGRLATARAHLAGIPAGSLSEASHRKADRLRRVVLFGELAADSGRGPQIIEELDRLSRTPHQRGRFLQAKSSTELRRGNVDAAIESSRAYAALDISGLTRAPGDATHLMSPQSWLAAADDRLRTSLPDASLDRVRARIAVEERAARESGDERAMERFVSIYPSWPEADAVRLRLAARLAEKGELQRAELMLLQIRRGENRTTSIGAARQLARLWDRAGLPEEAAGLLAELEDAAAQNAGDPQAGNAELPDPRALVAEFSPDSLTRLAYQRLKEAGQPVGRTRIRQNFWEQCDGQLADTYASNARLFVTRPASPFQLIDLGSHSVAQIHIVDRLCGTVAGELTVPAPYSGSLLAMMSQVGHFVPVGSRASMHGLSLLERDRRRPLWTTSPPAIARDTEQTLVGPTGPTFCTFQSHRHLLVLDPATGRVLWQRTDLDPQSGLAADPIRGVFGDDEVLVVMAGDHVNYTVYRTATGEEVRQGRLDNDVRQLQERRTFGRCLFHFTSDATSRRVRIWDPLTDRMLYNRPAGERCLWRDTGDEEIAAVGADGMLEIVDGHTGAIRASVRLDAEQVRGASQLVVFRDFGRYYVNLQPLQQQAESNDRYTYCYGSETVIPRADLRGEFLAIERRTGRLLWKRTLPQRTALRPPVLRLPFLVMLSIVQDRSNGNYRALLVEVVDANTGETLGLANNQLPDRFLQLTYHHDERRVRLWGTNSVVDIGFQKAPEVLSADARDAP